MDAAKVAVATIAWARSADEERLLVESLQRLSRTGLRVAVADRSSRRTMIDQLERLPNFQVIRAEEHTLVGQVKASFELASTFASDFLLYTEPDKALFFANGVLDFIDRATPAEDTGVILAGRSVHALRTYPPMQQYAEGVVNHLCSELIGPRVDYSYGPFLVHRRLLAAIAQIPAPVGWGWRTRTFIRAHRLGLRVGDIVGDYVCPPDQLAEHDDDRRHRLRQLSENIDGLLD